jgi:hypothetical protein
LWYITLHCGIVGTFCIATVTTMTEHQDHSKKQPQQPKASSTRFSLRALLVAVILLMTGVTISRKPPESIVSGFSNCANAIIARGGERKEEPTGTDLHLSVCGVTWDEYYKQLPPADPDKQSYHAFQWTISGGDEYRENAHIILAKWKTLGIDPVLVVALDENTARTVCEAGFASVHWAAPIASYSLVADSKFIVAASLGERGYRGYFIEMDVFCRKNPVPYFLKYKQDLVNVGHGDVGYAVNIGSFMASPKMGPFFQGMRKVLSYSLDNREHTDHNNNTNEFFDQSIYRHCLPIVQQNEDDDIIKSQYEYYLQDDKEKKNDLLKHCRVFYNFSHNMVPHHVMSSHDPPTIYDSTHCIHPLASQPFTPLAFKMGAAKFFGWDPKPIGPDEKLLKLYAGDLEYNNCWNRVLDHEKLRMDEFSFYDKVAMALSAMVEIAEYTNRTLVLPQYITSHDAWALPTHGIVDVRTLGVPYRSMTRQESYQLREEDTEVVIAAHNFSETFRRTIDSKYADVKVLAINKICNVRDYKLEVLEERRKKMGWCFDKDQKWSKAMGAWMDFCEAS